MDDTKTPEIVDNTIDDKIGLKLSDLPDKQVALALLTDSGQSVPEAAKALGYNTDYAYHINKKLSKYKIGNNKKMIVSAVNTIKNCISGTPFGSVDKIKDSTALAASQMVMDRFDPVTRQSLNVNVNANINPVDLSKYRNDNK